MLCVVDIVGIGIGGQRIRIWVLDYLRCGMLEGLFLKDL